MARPSREQRPRVEAGRLGARQQAGGSGWRRLSVVEGPDRAPRPKPSRPAQGQGRSAAAAAGGRSPARPSGPWCNARNCHHCQQAPGRLADVAGGLGRGGCGCSRVLQRAGAGRVWPPQIERLATSRRDLALGAGSVVAKKGQGPAAPSGHAEALGCLPTANVGSELANGLQAAPGPGDAIRHGDQGAGRCGARR